MSPVPCPHHSQLQAHGTYFSSWYELLSLALDLVSSSTKYGEGNGTPLQYSCLESPMDGGAWWAAVHGVAKSQTRLSDFHFHFSLSCIGEGNGNPLQCSCQENPRDGGAWWAAVHGVAQSRTRLRRLSSSKPVLPLGKIQTLPSLGGELGLGYPLLAQPGFSFQITCCCCCCC